MADDTKLLMTVPRDIIDAQIRAAVAQALAVNPERMVRAVVDMALSRKRNEYDSRPMWEAAMDDMIRDVAKEEFKAWCEAQRPAIAKAIREKLGGNAKGLVDKIATKLADGLQNVHLSVSWPDK